MAADNAAGDTAHLSADGRAQQIVAAAYELLEEDGLEGLTIRAVLARTGLARRAFYDLFAGKDDLVLAVFEQTLRLASAFFGDQVAGLPTPLDRLHRIVISIVLGRSAPGLAGLPQTSRRSAALSREHLRLAEARPADLQRAVAPLIALIAQQLTDGMAVGQVRQTDPHRLAMLVYNLVSTTVHTELLAEDDARPDPDRRRTLANDIWDFCHRAISTAPEQSPRRTGQDHANAG